MRTIYDIGEADEPPRCPNHHPKWASRCRLYAGHEPVACRDVRGIEWIAAPARTYCGYCRQWHTATATPDPGAFRRDHDTGGI